MAWKISKADREFGLVNMVFDTTDDYDAFMQLFGGNG